MIKEKIQSTITEVLAQLGEAAADFDVDTPKEKNHGDYFTNVALVLSKKLNVAPAALAHKIAREIRDALFEKVEVAGPGFINFYLSKDFLAANIREILKNKQFGSNQALKNKKVIIEYTDPNPFKEFHIGHLMSNSIGEALSRLIEFSGAKVKRANYQGDVGMHVAKAIYGKLKNSLYPWQDAYVFGARAYEEDERAKKEITELNKKIFERSDKAVNALYDRGRQESLKYFERIYQKLGTKFDYYFFESEVAGIGKKTVEDAVKKGIFQEGEKGAVVFKGEAFGLHTRVFINSEGLPTYEAKELGLANIKYKKFAYDISVVVTGKEVNEYFKVLLCAMGQLFPDLAKKTKHIGHGMMRLPDGKMSSRTGNVVTADSLLGEIQTMVLEKIKGRELSEREKEHIIEAAAVGAVKYSILRQAVGGDIVYDAEKSISFEGDSGPYLQYSYARAQSVLKKAGREGIRVKGDVRMRPEGQNTLERMMVHFADIVAKACAEYQPHHITLYLTELAREFNHYYAHHKIVDADDPSSPYNVALVKAFSIIMKNGLWLLGIQAPDKM